jgi:hypothetical protein
MLQSFICWLIFAAVVAFSVWIADHDVRIPRYETDIGAWLILSNATMMISSMIIHDQFSTFRAAALIIGFIPIAWTSKDGDVTISLCVSWFLNSALHLRVWLISHGIGDLSHLPPIVVGASALLLMFGDGAARVAPIVLAILITPLLTWGLYERGTPPVVSIARVWEPIMSNTDEMP